MVGIFLKDFYMLKKQIITLLPIIFLMSLSGTEQWIILVSFISSTLAITSMAYDKQSNWIDFENMLPCSKLGIVFSKFVIGYMGIFISLIISILGTTVINFINTGVFTINFNFDFIFVGECLVLIFLAINIVITNKFGAERGRLIFIIMVALVSASMSIIKSIGISGFFERLSNMSIVFFVSAIVINIISIFLSIKIRKNN